MICFYVKDFCTYVSPVDRVRAGDLNEGTRNDTIFSWLAKLVSAELGKIGGNGVGLVTILFFFFF